jgi:hypothetical protein
LSNVLRYSPVKRDDPFRDVGMDIDPDGRWVRYTDYVTLCEQLEREKRYATELSWQVNPEAMGR